VTTANFEKRSADWSKDTSKRGKGKPWTLETGAQKKKAGRSARLRGGGRKTRKTTFPTVRETKMPEG